VPVAHARNSSTSASCGKTKVHLSNPLYLTTSIGIVAVELPQGWVLDKTHKNPFFLVRSGENYEKARTLMYINIEHREVPFTIAVKNDERSFQASCRESRIQNLAGMEILERGCENKTQMFYCDKKQRADVDVATKISLGGLLVNIVLSTDNKAETARYWNDYEFLLQHLALVASLSG